MRSIIFLLVLLMSLLACTAYAASANALQLARVSSPSQWQQPSWNEWVAELREEAISEGISPRLFDRVFSNIHRPDRKTVRLDRSQPERRLTYLKYRKTRGDPYRIKLGKHNYKRNQALLREVGDAYGVDPCFIVSLWGMESSYGNYMGTFPVIKSLATLAYDPRRSDFFRRELLLALQILQEGHVQNKNYVGEWAGGSGQPQFLPSSFQKYAVDYNGDGKKDIWKNKADVFASIANYLAENGWQPGIPWGMEVSLPRGFDHSLIEAKHKMSAAQWAQMGVIGQHGERIPHTNWQASIVEPYGGPPLLVFKNFHVIKRYNNSTFYAGTVSYMADSICGRR